MGNIFHSCSSFNCFFCVFFSFCNVVPSTSSFTPINKEANDDKKLDFLLKIYQNLIQIFFSASLFDILLSSSKLPFTCWENRSHENQIKFTGTPYLFLGSCQFQCHQGGHKNVSKKRKFRQTQKQRLKGDHAEPIKTKKLTQLEKKLVVL